MEKRGFFLGSGVCFEREPGLSRCAETQDRPNVEAQSGGERVGRLGGETERLFQDRTRAWRGVSRVRLKKPHGGRWRKPVSATPTPRLRMSQRSRAPAEACGPVSSARTPGGLWHGERLRSPTAGPQEGRTEVRMDWSVLE